jgi:hypothetical protein
MYTVEYLWSYWFSIEINVECIKFQKYDIFFATGEIHKHEIIDLRFWEATLIPEVYCACTPILDFVWSSALKIFHIIIP